MWPPCLRRIRRFHPNLARRCRLKQAPIPAWRGLRRTPTWPSLASPRLRLASCRTLEPERDADDLSALFGHQQRAVENGIEGGISRLYRPIREDEFYSSGFLSEEQKLPFGQLRARLLPSRSAPRLLIKGRGSIPRSVSVRRQGPSMKSAILSSSSASTARSMTGAWCWCPPV